MRLRILALVTAFILMVAPSALAAPTIKVTIVASDDEVEIAHGAERRIDLNLTVEIKEHTCTSGTKIGVNLFPPNEKTPPSWLHGDPHPDGDTFETPRQTKPVSLTLVVDEDAPGEARGVYTLQPVVSRPNPANCGGVEAAVDAPEFFVTVRTPKSTVSPGATDPGAENGGDSPGLGAFVVVLLCVGVGLVRRRRQ